MQWYDNRRYPSWNTACACKLLYIRLYGVREVRQRIRGLLPIAERFRLFKHNYRTIVGPAPVGTATTRARPEVTP